MTNSQKSPPDTAPRGQSRKEERDARLAKALRDNLRRRKDQARSRSVDDTTDTQEDSHDSPVKRT